MATETSKRATHTPGPWQWDEPSNWHGLSTRVCTATYEPVAQVQLSGWSRRVGLANARLIAAAPDLLAACKHLVDIETSGETTCSYCHELHEGDCCCPVHLARAAIAKAERSAP